MLSVLFYILFCLLTFTTHSPNYKKTKFGRQASKLLRSNRIGSDNIGSTRKCALLKDQLSNNGGLRNVTILLNLVEQIELHLGKEKLYNVSQENLKIKVIYTNLCSGKSVNLTTYNITELCPILTMILRCLPGPLLHISIKKFLIREQNSHDSIPQYVKEIFIRMITFMTEIKKELLIFIIEHLQRIFLYQTMSAREVNSLLNSFSPIVLGNSSRAFPKNLEAQADMMVRESSIMKYIITVDYRAYWRILFPSHFDTILTAKNDTKLQVWKLKTLY